MLRDRSLVWLLGLAVLLAACAAPPVAGRLEVRLEGVDGLASGDWPGYRLTGPNYARTFQQSASLPGREPGSYTIEAPAFEARGNRYAAQVRFGQSVINTGVLASNQTLEISVVYTSTPVVVNPTTGTLNLSVSGPGLEGFAPSVAVSGPGGFSQTVTASGATALTGLAPGSYRVAAGPVSAQGINLAPPSSQVNQTLSVVAGQAVQATVAYAPTNSSITVTLSGLEAGDLPTVTLRPSGGPAIVCASDSPASVCARTQNRVQFLGVPFAEYQVSASAARGAFQSLGAATQTLTTSLGAPLGSLSFELVLRPSGQLVTGGNGSLLGANALYAAALADLGGLTVLGAPFSPLAATQYASVPVPEVSSACYDSTARSPSKMVFDRSGNLYVVYQGTTVSLASGCPAVYYNYATPVRRSIYLDAFILKVTPENLAARRFYSVATRTEVGTPETPLTRTGDTRTVEYAVPAPGNQVILKGAIPTSGQVYLEDFTPANNEPGVEVADLDFDASGNLWFVNKESGLIGCVAAAQLSSPNAEIRFANRALVNPYADPDSNRATQPAGVSPLLLNAFRNPGALAFDRSGNLWFTSDGWLFGGANFSRLSRIPQSALACPQTVPAASPALERVQPDVRLDVSLADLARAVFEPTDLVLAPDGNSLWIADGGSNDDIVLPSAQAGLCPRSARALVVGGVTSATQRSCSVGADAAEESLIQVPIRAPGGDHPNALPNEPGQPLRQAQVSDRVWVGGNALQQPTALAFDASGRLWVAANNNMNVTQALADAAVEGVPQYYQPQSAFRTALRDRRGKLYGLTIPADPSPNPAQPRPASGVLTLSADLNVGLTGVGLFVPSP